MDAGIDSIGGTELAARLSVLAGRTLSPTIMFELPTARALAGHILKSNYAAHDFQCSLVISGHSV